MIKLSIEEVKNLTQPCEDLIATIEETIEEIPSYSESNKICCLEIVYNEKKYFFKEIREDDWADDGKYQFSSLYYQLVSDEEDFNLFIKLPESRSGSYYSDYYYMFDEPVIFTAVIEKIPEVIIPAHEEVRFK